MLGDGSDGDLHVVNGQTLNLLLDHKYQYKSITVDAGGTITTNATSGSVLYLLCQGAVNISGNIILNNILPAGQNSWSTTIDGTTYNNPGVSNGGQGGSFSGQTAASQGLGYGGGGSGGAFAGPLSSGGAGGANGGSGGVGVLTATGSTANSTTYGQGSNGGVSAGGGGASYAYSQTTSGSSRGASIGYAGGTGGAAFGNVGNDGANPAGTWNLTFNAGDGGNINFGYGSAGGGGAGGAAGKPGIHLVIKGSEVNFLAGSLVNTSATNGQAGGNGGAGYDANGFSGSASGLGGGGGAGGSAGTLFIYYGTRFTNAGTVNRNGGSGGGGGYQIGTNIQTGQSAAAGNPGSYFATRAAAAYGSMMDMFG